MKRSIVPWALAIPGCVGLVRADTTIDPAHSCAYGADVGWVNARGDVAHGAVLGHRIEHAVALTNGAPWSDSGLGQMIPDPGAVMTRGIFDPACTTRFYRVRAVVPLSE